MTAQQKQQTQTQVTVFKYDYFDSEEKPNSGWQLERPTKVGVLGFKLLFMKREMYPFMSSIENSKSVPEFNHKDKSKWTA